jgi:hypothetical protein
MSSFYDDASWLLIPSGIKEDVVYAQKPTSGLGDLTFTRASDATYTDSTGVVRRSPYNLFTQSVWTGGGVNIAPAGWSQSQTTGNFEPQTAINGSVPYRFYGTAGRRFLFQSLNVVSGQEFRISIFVNSVAVSTTLSGMFQVTGVTLANFKYYVNNVEVLDSTLITANTRIELSFTVTSTGSATLRVGGGSAGAATYDYVILQPQLVEGTSALDYFPTTNRQDVPRIDFRNADGTLSSCGRLLLEPQRTNSIRNSSMVGAVAGSPGTTPTGWISGNAGLTRTIVGIGTENGLPYIDFRYNGTANSTIAFLGYGANTDTAAANGQTWTSAIYAKVIAQPTPPVSYSQNFRLGQSGGSFLSNTTQNFTPTTTLARYAHTVTIANASTLFASSEFYANLTNGATYDFTIRLAAPQMELGSYATTWVPTTTAAVTRIADVASKTGVSSLIGQTEGTLFYEFSVPVNENLTRSIGVTDGTVSNRINISVFATSLFARVDVGGVNQVNSSATIVPTAMNKVAFRYKANDFAAYVNGVKVITDTSGSTFSGTTLSSFSFIQPDGTSAFNGNVGQIAFFKTALTDDQLEVLTSEGYGTYALLAQSLNCVLQ